MKVLERTNSSWGPMPFRKLPLVVADAPKPPKRRKSKPRFTTGQLGSLVVRDLDVEVRDLDLEQTFTISASGESGNTIAMGDFQNVAVDVAGSALTWWGWMPSTSLTAFGDDVYSLYAEFSDAMLINVNEIEADESLLPVGLRTTPLSPTAAAELRALLAGGERETIVATEAIQAGNVADLLNRRRAR